MTATEDDIETTALAIAEDTGPRPLGIIVCMTKPEAQGCVAAIKAAAANARQLIGQLYHRDGWKALGYASWTDCVRSELAHCQSHCYRVKDAYQIERQVSPDGEIGRIPEATLRPLKRVPDLLRKPIYDHAAARASAKGAIGHPTSTEIDASISEILYACGESEDAISDVTEDSAPEAIRDAIDREEAAASDAADSIDSRRVTDREDARRIRGLQHFKIGLKATKALQAQVAEAFARGALAWLDESDKALADRIPAYRDLYALLGPPEAVK